MRQRNDENRRRHAEHSPEPVLGKDWQLFGSSAFSVMAEITEHVEDLQRAVTDEQKDRLNGEYLNRVWHRLGPYHFNYVSEVFAYAASLASDSLRYEYLREFLARLTWRRGGALKECLAVESITKSGVPIMSRKLLTLTVDDIRELEIARDHLRAKLLMPRRAEPAAPRHRLFGDIPDGEEYDDVWNFFASFKAYSHNAELLVIPHGTTQWVVRERFREVHQSECNLKLSSTFCDANGRTRTAKHWGGLHAPK